jgi:hypothetical protein
VNDTITMRRVTKSSTSALIIDGKFTPPGRWAALDLDTLDWECDQPEWFETAVNELRWARDCGENNAAIMLDDTALLMHPYSLTLRDAIDNLEADWSFDPFLNCFTIAKPQRHTDALREICDIYSIATSIRFEDAIDGLEEASATVVRGAQEALEAGFEIPAGFSSGRVLKDHQVEGSLSLAASGGGLLADQVGLGKGGTFVCGLLSLNGWLDKQGLKANFPVIVSVTKSMKLEIAEEISKWDGDARIEVLSGTKAAPIAKDADFIVVNHDILNGRLDDLLELQPRAFIADEAHVFKNKEAKRTEAALAITKAVRKNTDHPYVVLATGTPFLNSPKELWALQCLLALDQLFFQAAREAYKDEHGTTKMRTRIGHTKNRFQQKSKQGGSGSIQWAERELWAQRAFEVQWCGGVYDKYGAWHNDRATNTAQLNKLLLETGMVRRRKSDVIHPLPPLDEKLFRFDLDDDAMREYEEISDTFRDWLIAEVRAEAKRMGRSPTRAISAAVRKLMAGEDVMRLTHLRARLAQLKVPHTVDWIHRFMSGEITGGDKSRRKLVLFVHHRQALKELLDDPSLKQYNPVHILAGADQKETSVVDHKHRFQEDPNVRLIICSMAAREGHTLTAAKDVYLHEMPFVPSWIVQMAGRCWARMSEQFEPHEAYLHYAIANDTIDSMLVRMNAVKKSMFSSVIDGEGQDDSHDDILWGKKDKSKQDRKSWQEERAESEARLLEAFSIGTRDLEIAQ